ncbi:transposase, partial [Patescibacteria group bacterium]|nr:transposase [Patescibacteria group bacterium]
GIPLSKILAVGSAHDRPLAIPTIENIPAALTAEIRKMLADKGYDNSHMRAYLKSIGIDPDIPEKEPYITWREKINLMARGRYRLKGQTSNHKRFAVERTNAWIKSFRRLRFRFDYSILSFTAFLNLAFVVICIRKLIP